MPDPSSGDTEFSDPALSDLPEVKADLEEARRLFDRLQDRKGETDPDRYERLAERYQEKIERLWPEVERLTDEGQTRKLELENRLAHQRERAEDAAAELEEIEKLYEEGAMGEETYREERRRFRRQKKEAEKKASQIERELDEVEFYLTETGEADYQKERVWGTAEEALDRVQEATAGLSAWIPGLSSRSGGRGSSESGPRRFLPSQKTVGMIALVVILLFALNWALGLYIADQIEPALQSRTSQLESEGDLDVTYGEVGVNPFFRSLSISEGRVEPRSGPGRLRWKEASLGLSLGTIWRAGTGGDLQNLQALSFSAQNVRFVGNMGRVQVQSLSAEFEGYVRRAMFKKESPRPLLQRRQYLSVQVTGPEVSGVATAAADLLTPTTVQRLFNINSAGAELRFNPDDRTIRAQFSVEKPKSDIEMSGKMTYGFDRAGSDRFEPRRLHLSGDVSVRDIPYQVPEGPQVQMKRFEMWTRSPLVLTFDSDLPLPEGRLLMELDQRVTEEQVGREVRRMLRKFGIEPSTLKKPVEARVDYEYEGNSLRLRNSSLSTGIGTVNVDGRLQVSERGGQFRGLRVRLQEVPSEVEEQLRNQLRRMLNQRIPQGGEDIAFELTGSIDDPSVRPIQ